MSYRKTGLVPLGDCSGFAAHRSKIEMLRNEMPGIGVLNEKPLHAALKQWYARPGVWAAVRKRGVLAVIRVFRWDESASSSRGGVGCGGRRRVEGESGRKAAGDGTVWARHPSPADGLGLVAPAAISIAGLGVGVQAVSVAWRLLLPTVDASSAICASEWSTSARGAIGASATARGAAAGRLGCGVGGRRGAGISRAVAGAMLMPSARPPTGSAGRQGKK